MATCGEIFTFTTSCEVSPNIMPVNAIVIRLAKAFFRRARCFQTKIFHIKVGKIVPTGQGFTNFYLIISINHVFLRLETFPGRRVKLTIFIIKVKILTFVLS